MDGGTRDRLGSLLLPWFVHRDDPSRIIDLNIDAIDSARPLRVRDLTDPVIRSVLGGEWRADGTTKLGRIQAHRRRFEPCGAIVLIVPACDTGCGPMLVDGCHRSCAVYLLDPPHVELGLVFVQLPANDPALVAVQFALGHG